MDEAVRVSHLQHLRRTFGWLWKLPWENTNKEIFWRLAVNGVAGAGGHDICPRGQCPCGYAMSAEERRPGQGCLLRQHYFWDCPVAVAVREQLAAALPAAQSQHHLWIMHLPAGASHQGVWRVVCLAALLAMEHGRKALWRLTIEQAEGTHSLFRCML